MTGRISFGSRLERTIASATTSAAAATVDGPPPSDVGDEARERAGEEDPDQKPAHNLPDDRAPVALAGELGSERDQHLCRDRAETDDYEDCDQYPDVRGDRGEHEPECGDREHRRHESPTRHAIADRHEQSEAERVADLRAGDDERGDARTRVEGAGDRVQQRLRVVEVGDRNPAGGGEEEDESVGENARARRLRRASGMLSSLRS